MNRTCFMCSIYKSEVSLTIFVILNKKWFRVSSMKHEENTTFPIQLLKWFSQAKNTLHTKHHTLNFHLNLLLFCVAVGIIKGRTTKNPHDTILLFSGN